MAVKTKEYTASENADQSLNFIDCIMTVQNRWKSCWTSSSFKGFKRSTAFSIFRLVMRHDTLRKRDIPSASLAARFLPFRCPASGPKYTATGNLPFPPLVIETDFGQAW